MNPAQSDLMKSNAKCIEREIVWFRQIMEDRLKQYNNGSKPTENSAELSAPPEFENNAVPYAHVVTKNKLQPADRLVLILSFLPHIQPEVLDSFLVRNQPLDRRYTEFGGLVGQSHSGFLPTGETAMFLLAGTNLSARIRHSNIFKKDHTLFANGVLHLDHQHVDEPSLSAVLQLSPDFRERMITGQPYIPPFSSAFPAQEITTQLDWEDLVLDRITRREIEEIVTWSQQKEFLLEQWQLGERIKPGFRSLFYGPPGTGKTMTACLLGKKCNLPVFRIDLSRVVSKYIGETEKNLANLFDQAQDQNWILFFDEADSLFGKRTESRNSNDRAANQQTSYLLQRIEDYPGIAILATNLRSHLDQAFSRRFQSMIRFSMPNVDQRLSLWKKNFTDKPFEISHEIDFFKLASEHELTGGNIVNVLRYACLKAVERDPQTICEEDLIQGIGREIQKEGRLPR